MLSSVVTGKANDDPACDATEVRCGSWRRSGVAGDGTGAAGRSRATSGCRDGLHQKDPNGQLRVAAFRQQLQKLGWTEGRNIQIDFRYAADNPTGIRELAIELLGMGPDLIASNSNVVTTILQPEVRSIPLLFISVSDQGDVSTTRTMPLIAKPHRMGLVFVES
jgi:hypothetical protein